MKACSIVSCALCLMVSFTIRAQNFDPKNVLPKSLAQYRFGMSLDDFTGKNKTATLLDGKQSFRIEYQEIAPATDIRKVTYYFDADDNKPLYEMIIEFNSVESLNEHCSKKLGTANAGKRWTRTTKNGHTFKAWRFGTTLVYALGLPDTEWEKDWDN